MPLSPQFRSLSAMNDATCIASNFLLVSSAIILSFASLLTSLRNNHSSASSLHLWRARWFFPSIVGVAIVYQFNLLSEASIARIGSEVGRGESLYRMDCLRSRKGGKRPFGDTSEDFWHPCYNHANGTKSDETLDSTLCSASTTMETPYITATRDCHMGQSSRCTLAQPCVPCEISRRDEFRTRWSRCQACSVRNDHGRCNFKDGVGPYCWAGADGLDVVPCQRCCTEHAAMNDRDGACY
jgi:hypothetical protein